MSLLDRTARADALQRGIVTKRPNTFRAFVATDCQNGFHIRRTDLTGLMPLKVTCPRCGTLHRNIGKALLGQQFQCTCGKVVRLGPRSGSVSSRPVPQPVKRESRAAPTPVTRSDHQLTVSAPRVVQTSQRPDPVDDARKTNASIASDAEKTGEEDIVGNEGFILITEADIIPDPPPEKPEQKKEEPIVAPTRIIRPGKQSS